MTFDHRGWKPAEQLFEEAGVMYSWNQVDDFTAYHYTLTYIPAGVEFSRTVYIMGSDIDTLLAHWNRGDDWECRRSV